MPALIARRGRVPALTIAVVGALVFLALAVVVWHGTTTRFDTWAARGAQEHFGSQHALQRRVWLVFSLPGVSFAVPGAIGAWALLTRRWRVVALTVLGPLVALGFTEVAKPVIDRVIGPFVLLGGTDGSQSGSYPSGHETGTVAWLVVVVVLVWAWTADLRARSAVLVGAVLWAAAGAVGLTVNAYHYATDTIGAVGSTTAIVLGTALVVDVVADRIHAAATSSTGRGVS